MMRKRDVIDARRRIRRQKDDQEGRAGENQARPCRSWRSMDNGDGGRNSCSRTGGGASGADSATTTETLDDATGDSHERRRRSGIPFGQVSTKRGASAESFRAERILLMAVPRLWSKSTKVSAGHNLFRISSRETTSPGRSSSITKRSKGWDCRRILWPSRRTHRSRGAQQNDRKG